MNNMLTLEEVKNFLEMNQSEVERSIQKGKLHAYKIGGTYLRFRKEEVLNLRFERHPPVEKAGSSASLFSRLRDFWRFNNFYIVSLVLVVVLIFFMFRI